MDKYSTLNQPQYDAVTTVDGPLLLLAGAGSGKTRVLTHRIAYLIEEKDIKPWKIMAITFTNKAAKEMRERVNALIGTGGSEVWVSTFHSTCVRILRRYIDKIGYSKSFTIYDSDDCKKVVRKIMKEQNIDSKYYKESAVVAEISSQKNQMIGPDTFKKAVVGDMRKETIARIYTAYQKELQKNNALDFDDLLVKTVELFQRDVAVLQYYQNLFQYVMVDEYQDTNGVQFKLVHLLAQAHKNLCVVGDDDQSIYRFRGADIRNILDFESVFPEAKVIRLEQNYRSTKNILGAANEVIRNNTRRKVKKLWTNNDEGERLQHKTMNNEKEEADFISNIIGTEIDDNGRDFRDFAILYRTNAQSRVIEELLFKHCIPYRLVGGVSFYQRKEIKDILAYLRILENTTDSVSLTRVINVPKRGIGATTIDKVSEYADYCGISFYEAIAQVDEIPGINRARTKIQKFVELIEELKVIKETKTLDVLIEELLSRTNYIEELKAENTPEALDRVDNVEELKSKIIEYQKEAKENASLASFLEDVALVAAIDQVGDDDNKVILMTLHSAKGLEFPIVFMAGMEDGLFPSFMSLNSGSKEDLEEERRLCYVGITRAKEKLFLTSAKSRMLRGQTMYNMTSRFLTEIPSEYLVSESVKFVEYKDTKQEYFKQKDTFFHAKPFAGSKPNSIPKPTGVELEYKTNDLVKHSKYGIGQVVAIESGGADYQVTVNFPSHGKKKLLASFAKLKKM